MSELDKSEVESTTGILGDTGTIEQLEHGKGVIVVSRGVRGGVLVDTFFMGIIEVFVATELE